MSVRNLKKLKPGILKALLHEVDFARLPVAEQTALITELEQKSDEELFIAYCEWHGLINWGKTLIEVLTSIKNSNVHPMWCYHTVPVEDSLLKTLNSLPYEAEFVTIQNGQVVYRCNI